MRVLELFCAASLTLVGVTEALAIITSDAAGSHAVEPGTIAFGLNLDGIVSFEDPEFGGTIGTGILISDRHILTAAHVAEFVDPRGYQARFYLPTGNPGIDLVPMQAKYPARWIESERSEADIAILELAIDAPAAAPRYSLYGLNDEVGKPAVVTGHGAIGLGTLGGRDLINDLILHAGLNRIEARAEDLPDEIIDAAAGDLLVFDFDSGQAANNVLDLPGITSDLGYGADEVGVYIGDSGGPLFIDGVVAGLNRAILGGLDGDYTSAEDGSWGELAFVTRVSSYQDFIASATGGQAVFMPTLGAWNIDDSGNWSTAANWTGGVPNGSGKPAVFGAVITSPRTVTVDIPVTVGRIQFNNSHAYTLAGDDPITLDVVSGDALINVVRGSHVIAAPITLLDNTLITVTPSTSSLSMTGELNASGVNIAKAGKGTLTVNYIRAIGLSINDGTVAVAFSSGAPEDNTSVVNGLTIAGDAAPTATLDLANNAAVINYAGASPAATIRQQIIAGRGGAGLGGTWTGRGITSSTAATLNQTAHDSRSLGYAENSTMPLGAYTTFRGQPVDGTSVLIAYTRTGDANLDGVVNNDDVAVVGANYAPGSPRPRWDLGDFDYNGFVDNDDITLLGAFYNPSALPSIAEIPSPATGLAAVPEPTTVSLLAMAVIVTALSRSRSAAKCRRRCWLSS